MGAEDLEEVESQIESVIRNKTCSSCSLVGAHLRAAGVLAALIRETSNKG